MRYFLAAFALFVVLLVGTAGFRGGMSRKPPIEVFPDMDRQLKLRPQTPNNFFADGRSSRMPVPGTIARSTPFSNLTGADAQRPTYPFEEVPASTGRIVGTTNFVETGPFAITTQLMERGHGRYEIYCSPCHGLLGDGNGVTKKLGMATVANLHDPRIVRLPDGELFHVITNGRNTMGPYAPQIDINDRWAIVAYVRALQVSRLASVNDVPEQLRSTLKK
jgi:mono/diheme cytochrome c family protein